MLISLPTCMRACSSVTPKVDLWHDIVIARRFRRPDVRWRLEIPSDKRVDGEGRGDLWRGELWQEAEGRG